MLLRVRWFVLGATASVGAISYLAAKVKRAREQITAQALVRGSGRAVASLLDKAADRIRP